MSIKHIENALSEFIPSPEPRIIALTGKWGIGKTYFWKKFIEKTNINKSKYVYISLYGISNVIDFKNSIINSSINYVGTKSIFKYAPEIEIFGIKVDGEKIGYKINDLLYSKITNIIICIDDLERRGVELKINDIFGVISELNEQKKCRIVIIFNENQLEEIDDYNKQKEKVIDREIVFSPTAKENIDIVFNEGSFADEFAKINAEKLGISNIRILFKIKRLFKEILPHLDNDEELIKKTIKSCVLLGWSFYGHGDGSIPISCIFSRNMYSFFKNEEKTDDDIKWDSILNIYEWVTTDEMDMEIIKFIENGAINTDSLKAIVSDKKYYFAQNLFVKELYGIWDLYHNRFTDNSTDILGKFCQIIDTDNKFLSLQQFDNIVWLFRELEGDFRANEIINFWIEKNKIRLFKKLHENEDLEMNELKDSYLIEVCKKAHQENKILPPLKDVLIDLTKNNGWNTIDEEVMSLATEDDYYNFFMNNNEYVHRVAKKLNNFKETLYPLKEGNKSINEKCKIALKKISNLSKINRLRMRRHKLDDTPQ